MLVATTDMKGPSQGSQRTASLSAEDPLMSMLGKEETDHLVRAESRLGDPINFRIEHLFHPGQGRRLGERQQPRDYPHHFRPPKPMEWVMSRQVPLVVWELGIELVSRMTL